MSQYVIFDSIFSMLVLNNFDCMLSYSREVKMQDPTDTDRGFDSLSAQSYEMLKSPSDLTDHALKFSSFCGEGKKEVDDPGSLFQSNTIN